MVTYPITIGRSRYRGKDRQKKQIVAAENRHAIALEAQINTLLQQQEQPIRTYTWTELAALTGIALPLVQKFGAGMDGANSNGFIAWKHGMSYDEAMAADAG